MKDNNNEFLVSYDEFTSGKSIESFFESFRLFTLVLKSKSLSTRLNEETDWEEYSRKSLEEVRKKNSEEIQKKYKELEDKYPELVKIKDEAIKIEAETFKKIGPEMSEKFKKFEKELTDSEGFKAAMGVLRNFIKEIGVVKGFKLLKGFLSLMNDLADLEKKACKILPKGEVYIMPVIGMIKGGESESESLDVIKKIKDALSVKNLMKVLSGDTDDLEIQYMKKDGGEATGELKEVQVKDDGSIQVTIDNANVGEIKKDITEIKPEENQSDDINKKIIEFTKSKPQQATTVNKFIDFISNDKNKDKIEQIDKLLKER